jgi:hypothetical protein
MVLPPLGDKTDTDSDLKAVPFSEKSLTGLDRFQVGLREKKIISRTWLSETSTYVHLRRPSSLAGRGHRPRLQLGLPGL